MHALGADSRDHNSLTQHRNTSSTSSWEGFMQDTTTTAGLTHKESSPYERLIAPSRRAYVTLIGAAALSGAAMHMVRSTTAADLRDMLAQHYTMPVDLQQSSIDTSLQPFGL
jgi:hypothetical protein